VTRIPPRGEDDSPEWLAFELWADQHSVSEHPDDWLPWWECFDAGFSIGLIEGIGPVEAD
jgi:hypothetical protein